jgi:hypothetical protein
VTNAEAGFQNHKAGLVLPPFRQPIATEKNLNGHFAEGFATPVAQV